MPPEAQSSATVALLVTRGDRVALILAGPQQCHERDGYTFLPAELPGSAAEAPDDPQEDATRICGRYLSRVPTLRSSRRLYGPSPRHAIDVLPLQDMRAPLPLLQLVRFSPIEPDSEAPRQVTLRVYLTETSGDVGPAAGVGGLLWLTPRALRTALLGAPLADLLAEKAAELQNGPGVRFPANAFVYVPSEYGERHIVRIAAKYGTEALFQSEELE